MVKGLPYEGVRFINRQWHLSLLFGDSTVWRFITLKAFLRPCGSTTCRFGNVEESFVEVRGADSTLKKEVLWCGNSSIESKEISLH